MTLWEKFDFWLYTKYGMSPLGLVLRILIAILVLWAVAWALGTQNQLFR